MFDLFLKVIDRVLAVAYRRETDRKRLFLEIVEPLFERLPPVVDDYFMLFRRAEESIHHSTRPELEAAVAEIRHHRVALLHARHQVRQLAVEIQEHLRDKGVVDFARKVSEFFSSTQIDLKVPLSGGAELVELCDHVLEERLDKGRLLTYVQQTLTNLESRWIAVAQSYARLRIHCLSPPRFRKKKDGTSPAGSLPVLPARLVDDE